jgi:5-formyltetrahydrofolate cyclo-ligase
MLTKLAARKRVANRPPALSEALCTQLQSLADRHPGARIFAFWPMIDRGEVDIRPFLQQHWGHRAVLLPRVYPGHKLVFFRVSGPSGLSEGSYGIQEPNAPAGATEARPGEGDVVLVPGRLFSPSGHRIGYGGGYYDRYLKELHGPMTIGIVGHLHWIIDFTPQAHDVALTHLMTPGGLCLVD